MKKKAQELLQQALADPAADFRDGQWVCIEGLLRHRRLLVVQRTGWGKSMVYFLATRLLRDQGAGAALLISPLLSLMRNQIQAAERIGIRAATINSSNREDWETVQQQLHDGRVDILLISPERLANDDFREGVLLPVADKIGLFVVDEAHCISDWGHDFRPDYRRIVRVLLALPGNIPVLATTATANDRVVRDVAAQLGNLQVVRGPLVRESLRLQNIWMPNPAARMAWLAHQIPRIPGSGIVYTLTQRDAERVALWLRQNHIEAWAYHAGVEDREELETRLLDNQIKALVATVALGMGFDKPDLGFVIHFQRPGSVVHYYQQVGRAARGLDSAFGVLLGGHEDSDITHFFIRNAFPPQVHVDQVLAALNDAEDGLTMTMLEQRVNLRKGEIAKTIKYLSVESPAPIVKQGSRWFATPIDYVLDQAAIEKLCALRRAEQQVMLEYMQTRECLMHYLANALDDPHAGLCGKCANCEGQPLLPTAVDADLANAAALFLRRSYQVIDPRKRWPGAGAFPEFGFSGTITLKQRVEEGRALCLWGDAGWGEMVRQGKFEHGRFSDDLVAACAGMIEEAWRPNPLPRWLACVPSLNPKTAQLVPDFAQRLAARLGIPFVPCVHKTKGNRPQKEMQNSFSQARNLDGVFEVEETLMPDGPALLVDDLVDSRWTFTVVGALLKRAGCPAVFPVALAVSSPGGA
ncbi:RecQ family ATP-dependent DNA helicase [Desulfatitalea alkaliphila]|uniref:DNA 3'-5' helicase n=1 Tax=Desulfatitalea alkaliphila TaxID=2929485 RepID=A0AA41UJ15_9BACT|nr:RecQ family ATP-dependent DNA helicase [Desulfatitalea alkaliphila]MCJ8501375.1 RecQ family ATP-dependent DNA helicase [Desulfatitalea alkaliphila]